MLSAPKEEERLAVVSFTANDSNRGGFGKVLKSIEGLQQRLEDFSVEDIGQAEEQAKTLAVRLSELQRRLATLAEINEAIRAVDATVEQVSKESSELTKVQGADKVLQLQALVQANKLIRFPRLAKAAKESSRAGSVYPIAKDSQSHFSQAETAITTEIPNEDPTESLSTQSARPDDTLPPLEKLAAEPDLEATDSETTTTSSDVQEAQDLSSQEPSLESEAAPQTHSLDTEEAAFEATVHIAPAPEPTPARPDARTSETNTSADFDQRLLDDLIKNYGEFAISGNLPAVKPAKDSAAKPEKLQEQVESKSRAERPAIKNVPGVKKQGELDRQLKKIIKDYGEYDLYSHRSPVNLKTGVIGAFLLLAVLFLGFYFLSTKSQPPQDSSVTQSISDSSAPGESAAATNKEHRAGAGGSQDIQNRSSLKQKK